MFDERWLRIGKILVDYSTRVRAGDHVLIVMTEIETFPLARAVYEAAIKAGGLPHVQFTSALLERAIMSFGTQDQVDWVPEPELAGIRWADVYIGLRGARNPSEFAGISPPVLAAHRRSMGNVSKARTEKTRWVLMRIPNESFAQQVGMPTEEMMAFFFRATLRDWQEEKRRYEEVRRRFAQADTVRITGRGTDLSFSTSGRTYLVGDGTHNMPDGEIYTAPVDDSVEGTIAFEFPGIYAGRQIPEIRLTFEAGRVVSASASANEELLRYILEMDQGASRVGEFGVGLNSGIDQFTSEVLYDEKIWGTIHLALGRAYQECGGRNVSAVHWDIVKDLRTEGAICLDGEAVFREGRFFL